MGVQVLDHVFKASCGCGWKSVPRKSVESAMSDFTSHKEFMENMEDSVACRFRGIAGWERTRLS